MATVSTIRVQIYEALRAAVLARLSDPAWGISARNVVSEPSPVPEDEEVIGFRIITYNAQDGLVPQTLSYAAKENSRDVSIQDVRSTVRIQCYGAQAYAWLDVFLAALEDEELLVFFRERGFSVIGDGSGISDLGTFMGAREQTRGTASVEVACRSIRDRVITYAEQIEVTLALATQDDPENPDVRVITADLEEAP